MFSKKSKITSVSTQDTYQDVLTIINALGELEPILDSSETTLVKNIEKNIELARVAENQRNSQSIVNSLPSSTVSLTHDLPIPHEILNQFEKKSQNLQETAKYFMKTKNKSNESYVTQWWKWGMNFLHPSNHSQIQQPEKVNFINQEIQEGDMDFVSLELRN